MKRALLAIPYLLSLPFVLAFFAVVEMAKRYDAFAERKLR